MPTKRFYNLPSDKQQRIVDAAIDEFADKGLELASVAGVVDRAEIPRGSFYQYFSDLGDLFRHILDLIGQAKITYLSDAIKTAGQVPFFDFFSKCFARAFRFAEENPKLFAIARHLSSSTDEASQAIMHDARAEGVSFYSTLIEQDKQKGLIRADVDSILLARLLISISSEITLEQLFKEQKTSEEVLGAVASLLNIIQHGIMPKGEKSDV